MLPAERLPPFSLLKRQEDEYRAILYHEKSQASLRIVNSDSGFWLEALIPLGLPHPLLCEIPLLEDRLDGFLLFTGRIAVLAEGAFHQDPRVRRAASPFASRVS